MHIGMYWVMGPEIEYGHSLGLDICGEGLFVENTFMYFFLISSIFKGFEPMTLKALAILSYVKHTKQYLDLEFFSF
jgi:hypothetical protein